MGGRELQRIHFPISAAFHSTLVALKLHMWMEMEAIYMNIIFLTCHGTLLRCRTMTETQVQKIRDMQIVVTISHSWIWRVFITLWSLKISEFLNIWQSTPTSAVSVAKQAEIWYSMHYLRHIQKIWEKKVKPLASSWIRISLHLTILRLFWNSTPHILRFSGFWSYR